MSLKLKLLAMVLFVGVVPLLISTATAFSIHHAAYDRTVVQSRREAAERVAALVRQRFQAETASLALLGQQVVRWPELTPEERDGALWVVYRQVEDVAVASLLDASGKGLGPAAYQETRAEGHPPADAQLLSDFAHSIPTDPKGSQWLEGAPFTSGRAGPFLPLVLPVAGPRTDHWLLAVALSLDAICRDVREESPGIDLLLVDPSGRRVCDQGAGGDLLPVDASLRAAIQGEGTRSSQYLDGTGKGMLAAAAAATRDWTVVAREPVAVAYSASRQILVQSAIWILLSLLIAVVGGLYLAQGVLDPIKRLVDGADRFARGEFSHRIQTPGRDELGSLALAFNRMGGEVEKRDREIRAWNEELQARVEMRTRELKATQEQLLQSQKIAAVTSLGAGIAHEMNSPLAGILGLSQILISRERKAGRTPESLLSIEKEAQRLRSIIAQLVGISESFAGESFVRLKANSLLNEAVGPLEASLEKEGITLSRQLEPGDPEVLGDRAQLLEALAQIVDNARKAMPGGGRLALISAWLEQKQLVRLSINDTGRGIPEEALGKIFDPFFTTKDDWRGEGLGLTVAWRVVQRHHGTIKAESTVGRGTSIQITLPAAGTAHLA